MMMLELDNVTKSYAGNGQTVVALSAVTLQLEAGEFVAVRGDSGCGKSTMLLTAGTLMRPDQGKVLVDGQDPYRLSPESRSRFRAEKIGFVFQQFHLIPYLSVLDNVLAPALAGSGGQPEELRKRSTELLDRFGLSDRVDHTPSALSTGERQRVALARSLFHSPRVLLADEPTGNLDESNSRVVLEALKEFSVQGGAVMLVTHDEEAAAFAQRSILLDAGKLVSTE